MVRLRSRRSGLAPFRLLEFLACVLLLGLFLAGCSTDDSKAGAGDDGFVSDNPDVPADYFGGGNGGTGGSSGGGTGGGGGMGGDSPERAIEEADIVQTEGNRLYALSRYGGLSVIDVGVQDQLTLLGKFRTDATPFEMYLRGNIVVGLFDSYGSGSYNDDGVWEWHESSRVLTLDVSDANAIRVLSDSTLPGSVSDSRIVGDVLYVVSHENGYCWQCDTDPRTTVTSFNLSDPSHMTQIDSLAFADGQDEWGWAPRSVTVTDQRMYVAGRDFDETWGSKIQVVDISDPAGDMRLGIALRATGEIESRWQMDESNGVLRVISQPGVWNTAEPPELQTFAMQSSDAATHLATLQLRLPKPERLRSVRFDGDRAFAITAEQTDPLFTFDLSDPAAPEQLGELEVPGWVYHMEPRGDRLLALGFDNTNEAGGLHVSIFDVSDLTSPTLLSRVNFGGSWGFLPEDQDRIQKAFKLLEPEGLILVPFSGYGNDSDYCYRYSSGVQLIDWASDSLTLRGLVPSAGEARRAFLLNQRLFTVSDDRVESFDISDRDQPSRTALVSVARIVTQTAKVNGHLLRAGSDWWSQEILLDVVNTTDAGNPAGLAQLPISAEPKDECSYGTGVPGFFVDGNLTYVVYANDTREGQSTVVASVDLSNPTEPRLVSQYQLKAPGSQYWIYRRQNGVLPSGSDVAQLGSTLAAIRSEDYAVSENEPARMTVEVVDLSDPTQAKSAVVKLENSFGRTGLIVHEGAFYSSHFEPTQDGRVRFYLDRIDVSDPAHPSITKRNIPGSLLAIDQATGKLLTASYQRHTETLTAQECLDRYSGYAGFEYEGTDYSAPGTCTWLSHQLQLVDASDAIRLESKLTLKNDQRPSTTAMGDGVFFTQLDDPYADQTPKLHVISGFAAGKLELNELEVSSEEDWAHIVGVEAQGSRAVVVMPRSVHVIDASNPGSPSITQSQSVRENPVGVTFDTDRAYVALGFDGVLTLPLEAN